MPHIYIALQCFFSGSERDNTNLEPVFITSLRANTDLSRQLDCREVWEVRENLQICLENLPSHLLQFDHQKSEVWTASELQKWQFYQELKTFFHQH